MPSSNNLQTSLQVAERHLKAGLIEKATQRLDRIKEESDRDGRWHYLRGLCYLAQHGRDYGCLDSQSQPTKSLADEAILQFMQGFEKDRHAGCAYILYALYQKRQLETLIIMQGTDKERTITKEDALLYFSHAFSYGYSFAQGHWQAGDSPMMPMLELGQDSNGIAYTYNPDSENSLVNCTDPCGYYNFGTSLRSPLPTVTLMSGMALGLFIFSMAVVANPATVPVLLMVAAIVTLTSIVSTLIIGTCKFVRDSRHLKHEGVSDFYRQNPEQPNLLVTHRRLEPPPTVDDQSNFSQGSGPTSASSHLRGKVVPPGGSGSGLEPDPEGTIDPSPPDGPSI